MHAQGYRFRNVVLTLFDVTSFQLNGMICISKTVDFSTAADHTETTTV